MASEETVAANFTAVSETSDILELRGSGERKFTIFRGGGATCDVVIEIAEISQANWVVLQTLTADGVKLADGLFGGWDVRARCSAFTTGNCRIVLKGN